MSSFIENDNLTITNIEDSYFEDQYKSKQDVVFPPIIINDNHRAYLLFDGHGDNDCINIVKSLDQDKIKELLNKSTKDCMDFIIKSTNQCCGGAMMTLIEINNINNPFIKITWLGDSLVYVYNENNEIVGSSFAHNIIDDPESLPKQCTIDRPKISSSPQEDGITQKINYGIDVNPYYKLYIPYTNIKYGGERHTIASTRSLGHRGIFLSNKYSEKIINLTESGKYKIIGGSDGIWDVMNPKDKFLHDKIIARNIVKECRVRWRKEWILPNYRKDLDDPNSECWPPDTTTSMGDQDDICCICSIITLN